MDVVSARPVTLRDPDLEQQLELLGYVVVDVFDQATLDQISVVADQVYVDERVGFHASNLSGAHEYRHAVNRLVSPLVGDAVSHLFAGYEPFFSSLVVKWMDGDSSFPSHQDWNMVDETRFRSVNVFVPLTDMDEKNGALRVLPGSHRMLRSPRCSPTAPTGCESVGWSVTPDEMTLVELKRGQAIVFDHALLHCSGPNVTERPRWAAITAFKPIDAELFHWYLPTPESLDLELFRVDSDFFADFDIGNRPNGEPVATEHFVRTQLTKSELLSECETILATSAANIDSELSEPINEVRSSDVAGSGPPLQDSKLQKQLDELGWVTVDLLTQDELAELREAHSSLNHEIVLGRSFADGFHATVVDGREEYRRESDAAIARCLAGPCQRILQGVRLVMTNWVHKEPGAAAAPFHADWSFVNEPENHSISVWVPLVDTDEETGCMGVLSGSHLKTNYIRAAAHPDFDVASRVLSSWNGAQLIPLRAGQALVYDHRTVHFSQPHRGAEPRVAATCEFIPDSAELVHFEQLSSGRFRRHKVSREFFTTYVAGQDPRDVKGHLSYSDEDGPSFDLVEQHKKELTSGDTIPWWRRVAQIIKR